LEELWAPFKAPVKEVDADFRILKRPEGWELVVPGDQPLETDEVWTILMLLRARVVEQATNRSHSVIPLHAAVVMRDDVTLMLAGRTGAGKTTLAMELLKRDWISLCDDVAPLEMHTGQIQNFAKPIGIKDPENWAIYRRDWEVASWVEPPRGPFVIPASLVPRSREPVARVSHLLFPTRNQDGGAELIPISAAEGATELISDVDIARQGALRLIAQLCQSVPIARLHYGSIESTVDSIETFVGKS
jgi:hypothetical protein